jgi:hypothetical protein
MMYPHEILLFRYIRQLSKLPEKNKHVSILQLIAMSGVQNSTLQTIRFGQQRPNARQYDF